MHIVVCVCVCAIVISQGTDLYQLSAHDKITSTFYETIAKCFTCSYYRMTKNTTNSEDQETKAVLITTTTQEGSKQLVEIDDKRNDEHLIT